ncbi:MAG: SDR family oxidoreductase [Alphaproteobacteria bacterium]|nr:SDR family oxidoreductase [Alphaproteobacteria bacterium]
MAGFLDGRTALITGSTSGLGLGFARALAAEGCAIMLNGFGDTAEIETTRSGLESEFGVTVRYNGADMREPEQVVGMVEDATAQLGKVDILINNAGMQHRDPTEGFPVDKWDDMLAINLSAPFHATRAVLPQMKARDWGRIINTASTNALVASPNVVAYTATKHGILGMTKVVALETIETGVTCNAICPGTVRTNLSEHRIDTFAEEVGLPKEEALADYLAQKQPYHQPMGRFITVEEIAAAAVYLCSDAGAAMRGAAFTIDGGWTAR